MSATGRGSDRRAHDDYQTPPAAIHALLEHVTPTGRVLEPCWGSGNIAKAVARNPLALIYGGDISEGWDFLEQRHERYDWVVTNPPFSLAQEFIDRSLACADHVAMLLRLNFLESRKRLGWWQLRRPSALYALAERPGFLDRAGNRVLGKDGKPGTDACAYGWFVWSRLYSGIHVIGADETSARRASS